MESVMEIVGPGSEIGVTHICVHATDEGNNLWDILVAGAKLGYPTNVFKNTSINELKETRGCLIILTHSVAKTILNTITSPNILSNNCWLIIGPTIDEDNIVQHWLDKYIADSNFRYNLQLNSQLYFIFKGDLIFEFTYCDFLPLNNEYIPLYI